VRDHLCRRLPGELPAAPDTPARWSPPGPIPLLSFAVGFEVAGGFVLLLSEFLDQLLIVRR
jgi:hypothetical protein